MAGTPIDISTLSRDEVVAALTLHCHKMGSYPYYLQDEIARYDADPSCVTVFRDGESGKLRAYTSVR